MKNKQNISITILTYNEEKHIERCIKSLLLLAKEIFIVDSYSINKTVEMLEEMRANSKRLAYRFGWENIALEFKNLYESMTEKSHG